MDWPHQNKLHNPVNNTIGLGPPIPETFLLHYKTKEQLYVETFLTVLYISDGTYMDPIWVHGAV